ncbi:MAG TPA: hypothetical protein VGR06_15295 [Actinophytocola sp.]|uniref:WXG100 family type VII secretion target n=1 Tax=Actinophytocola sp. TaxID=1872138 RepID=UPI002DF7A3C6|nr:hypothetical protein [Actinophytocola sp.]
MASVEVEISDLRGWAEQVGRASKDMGSAHGYGTGNIADADFGRILEVITGDYAVLLPKFHAVLQADSGGLDMTSGALIATANDYKKMDERSRSHFTKLPGGETAHTTDDGVANGFDDTAPAAAKLVPPDDGGANLPEVSFGWLLDKVCDLIVWVGGPDPREYVTKWIAGDIKKAARQASAWQHVAECAETVRANLDTGKAAIARTWKGPAATASSGHMDKWHTVLTDQSTAMRKMSGHLKDAIEQAVKMAQVVVDIIHTVIDLVSAAWSGASIPVFGQWKLIKTVKEAITMVNSARKVIQTFWSAMTMIKDLIAAGVNAFSVDALPPTPSTAEVPG